MAFYFCKECKGKFMALSESEGAYFAKLHTTARLPSAGKLDVKFCPYCGGEKLEGGDSARRRKKKS